MMKQTIFKTRYGDNQRLGHAVWGILQIINSQNVDNVQIAKRPDFRTTICSEILGLCLAVNVAFANFIEYCCHK